MSALVSDLFAAERKESMSRFDFRLANLISVYFGDVVVVQLLDLLSGKYLRRRPARLLNLTG